MPAFDPAIDNLIVSATGSLEDANHVNPRDVLARLLISLGFNGMIVAGASPAVPANARSLWWDTNVSQPKRYNPLTSQWVNLTTDHYALHVFQRAINAAGVDTVLETGDLFPFFDVSRNETRAVTEATLRGLINNEVTGVITSSATEFIIDLTSLTPDTYYEFKGVIKWSVTGAIPPCTMRQRSSANANLNMKRDYNNGSPGEGDNIVFYPPGYYDPQDATTNSIIPMLFSFAVHSSPRKCAIMFSKNTQLDWTMVETRSATAAAKLHFTLPSGVSMNGKVMKP